MEHNYRINFSYGNLHIEIESTNIDWIKKKEKQYLKDIFNHSTKYIESGEEGSTLQKTFDLEKISLIDIKRKIRKFGIKGRSYYAIAFIFYLQNKRKLEMVSSKDIIDCFKEIDYPLKLSINMMERSLKIAKKRGFVKSTNEFWSLTTLGEDWILNLLASG